MMAFFGALLPRFLILVGWVNDQASWQSLYGSSVMLLFGFLLLPMDHAHLRHGPGERHDRPELDLRRPGHRAGPRDLGRRLLRESQAGQQLPRHVTGDLTTRDPRTRI